MKRTIKVFVGDAASWVGTLHSTGGTASPQQFIKIGVANGTRTRNNKLHKLGLYH